MKQFLAVFFAALFAASAHAQSLTGTAPAVLNQCGSLKGANLNTTADQQINFTPPSATYVFVVIRAQNPSAAVTTAVGGIYSGAGKTGTALVPASQAYSGLTTTSPNTTGNFVNLGTVSASYNFATLFFSLTTPEGSAKTADIYLYCYPAS